MKNKWEDLGKAFWVIGLVFAVFSLGLILLMLAFSQRSDWWWLVLDIIVAMSYVAGLILAKKWPLLGGLLSFVLPLTLVATSLMDLKNQPPEAVNEARKSILFFLFFMLPGFLHLIYWWLKKRSGKKEVA